MNHILVRFRLKFRYSQRMVMTMKHTLIFFLGMSFLCGSIASVKANPLDHVDSTLSKNIKVSNLVREVYSGAKTKQNLIIKSKKEWIALWKKIYSRMNPIPRVPYINFRKEIVIAALAGEFLTGGYVIEVFEIKQRRDQVEIQVHTRSPGKTCGVTHAFSQPIHLVKIKKTDAHKFIFKETNYVNDCSTY